MTTGKRFEIDPLSLRGQVESCADNRSIGVTALAYVAAFALAITLAAIVPHYAYAGDLQAGEIDDPSTSTAQESADDEAGRIDMYRMYNPNSGEHFYTGDANERDFLKSVGWRYEGTGWIAPTKSNTPVYRLYSGTDHHYTTSEYERDHLVSVGWSYEGTGWYSDDAQTVPLLRLFNPNVDPSADWGNSGSHHYTTSSVERDFLVQVGWRFEGAGWYALGEGSPEGDWVGTLTVASRTNQIIAVEARGLQARVSMHEKNDGIWSETIATEAGWIGKNGIGPAREGIAYTPQGLMYPTQAFGIQANPGCPMGYLQVDQTHYWCGDPYSPYYNKMISTRDTTNFDPSYGEHLISCGATYNYCLNMGWNTACTPHGGAAFFLHCSQGKPTDGCVTVPEPTMIQILRAIKPGCAMIVDTPTGVLKY